MKCIRMHAVPTTFIGKRTTLINTYLDIPLMPDWLEILVELDASCSYLNGCNLPIKPLSAEGIVLISEGPTKHKRVRR